MHHNCKHNDDLIDDIESEEDEDDGEESGYSDDLEFDSYSETLLHPMDMTSRYDQDELSALKVAF